MSRSARRASWASIGHTMPIISLFEHETKAFDWTDLDLKVLEQLRQTAGTEVLRPVVSRGQRALQAAQHVGVVRLGEHTIQVLPKVYRSHGREAQEEATRNLLHMLSWAGQLPVREHEIATLLKRRSDWFEILTRLFAARLVEEWQRGVHRGYQVIEDELPMLKGKWRIGEQLRHPVRDHILSVTYDEYTADNDLNRVFRYVVERLWRLTQDSGSRQLLGRLREWMSEVTLIPPITVRDAPPSLINRLNRRYEPLFNLACLFLEGSALQLAAGSTTTFTFMFDMNQLFELFLVNCIRMHWHDLRPSSLPEHCALIPQSYGTRKHVAFRGHRGVFLMRPDLAFHSDQTYPLLLDAKYKRLEGAECDFGVCQADFYQMFTYAHCFDCPRVLLLYPQTADVATSLRARFRLVGQERLVDVATIDLRVDLGTPQGWTVLCNELTEVLEADNGVSE